MYVKIGGLALGAFIAFGAGLACGWRLHGPGSEVAAGVAPKSTSRQVSQKDQDVVPSSPNEEKFEEAIPADVFRRQHQRDTASVAVVEEVRGEDGLTASEYTEKLKREHPDEWQAREQRRQMLRAARAQENKKQQTFLSAISSDLLTPEQRATHTAYLNALRQRDELREQLRTTRQGQNNPHAAADLQAAFNEANEHILSTSAAERRALFEAAARSTGLSGKDVSEFADNLFGILDATETRKRSHSMHD